MRGDDTSNSIWKLLHYVFWFVFSERIFSDIELIQVLRIQPWWHTWTQNLGSKPKGNPLSIHLVWGCNHYKKKNYLQIKREELVLVLVNRKGLSSLFTPPELLSWHQSGLGQVVEALFHCINKIVLLTTPLITASSYTKCKLTASP